jgi:chromosome segregation ATPase
MDPEIRQIIDALTAQTAIQAAQTEEIRRQTEEMRRRTEELTREHAEFRQQMAEFRQEMSEFRQENVEFRQQMAEFRQENVEFRQQMAEFRQENVEFRQQMAEFRQEMSEFRQELAANTVAVRRAHVLIEDNRSAIQLVAEGVLSANQRIDSLREEMNHRFDDQESFVRSSVGLLATNHGARLERLERHTGLN